MASNKSKWGNLAGLSGEVDRSYNAFDHIVESSSPSFNFLFANTHGLPQGLTLALIGPPKCGKTLIVNDIITKLHQSDPEAHVAKFDTEFRATSQGQTKLTSGIDLDRYFDWTVNTPKETFDRIELVVIDSINGIQGRRTLNADTIDQQQIGDWALTVGEGFKRILPVIRKYNMALIVTAHVRQEFDRLEIMRGNTTRAAIPLGVRHLIEYFVRVEADKTKDGRVFDEDQSDMKGNAVQTGHRIWTKMTDSSNGPPGRVAQFVLKYDTGIVNLGEEVADLGVATGVIEKPNQQSYKFQDSIWRGQKNLADALESNPELRKQVIDMIKERDAQNLIKPIQDAPLPPVSEQTVRMDDAYVSKIKRAAKDNPNNLKVFMDKK